MLVDFSTYLTNLNFHFTLNQYTIIQVAGSCNRKREKATKIVEVIRLYDPEAEISFCPSGEYNVMVYNPLAIGATKKIIGGCEEILENQIFDLAKEYFNEPKRKDLGEDRIKRFWIFLIKEKIEKIYADYNERRINRWKLI